MWAAGIHLLRVLNNPSFLQSSRLIKKENKTFLIYKEIQMGSGAKSYMRKGFLIYEEMRKYFAIYMEAVTHIWLCTWSLWISFLFYFYQFMATASQVSHLVSPCRLSGCSLGGCHLRSRWLAKWLEYRVDVCKLLWPQFTNYTWFD